MDGKEIKFIGGLTAVEMNDGRCQNVTYRLEHVGSADLRMVI
jgi:hypothetical protein